jgi:hypothetical protein
MEEASNRNEALSEYEILRQQKIQRNQEKLRSLGLLTSKDESTARGRSSKQTGSNQRPGDASNHKCTALVQSKGQAPPSQRRMSLRLRGIDPFPTGKKNSIKSHVRPQVLETTLVDVTNTNDDAVDWQCVHPPTSQTVCQAQPPQPRTGTSSTGNKSTTKEHCQMRIRTMSVPQLQQRIRIIERARGQHCIAKLAIMQECCIEANLYDLAQQAQDAIERLSRSE